jgi:transposase
MTLLLMSTNELCRLEVLDKLTDGRLTRRAAAEILALSERQIYRLLETFRQHGVAGLVSKKRGKPSNRCLPAALRHDVLAIVRERYPDFGPTFAAEKLAEVHAIQISRETLRQWMIEAGLWTTRRQRAKRIQQPRYRRDHLGELVQIDGSEHWWFEARGPQCTLLVFIDDATSRLMHLEFVTSESTFDYFRATRTYVEAYGKPVAFYSDKHTIFRVPKTGAVKGDGMTQFGRALHDLNIDIICANTSEAKGRVERANKTLQDRLVKELRLANISTIEAANRFLPGFIERHNAKFAKPPTSNTDLHRPLATHDSLDDSFCWREERTVSKQLTLQYNKVLFLLEPNAITSGLKRQRVAVYDYPDGRLAIRHKGIDLPYSIFDKIRQVDQAQIVDNKRLGAVLAYIREQQKQREQRRSTSSPRRRGQPNHMFNLPDPTTPPTTSS